MQNEIYDQKMKWLMQNKICDQKENWLKKRTNVPDQQVNWTITAKKEIKIWENKRIKQTKQKKSLLKLLKLLTWKPYMSQFNIFNNSRTSFEKNHFSTKGR